uniref:Uncharacterized protein n=1 Tax=Vitis vinifera TaxID=29760 RepID=A5BD52_VITVI|nr:hypothetical protein VITISV_011478 [Vitis vinifera]
MRKTKWKTFFQSHAKKLIPQNWPNPRIQIRPPLWPSELQHE